MNRASIVLRSPFLPVRKRLVLLDVINTIDAAHPVAQTHRIAAYKFLSEIHEGNVN